MKKFLVLFTFCSTLAHANQIDFLANKNLSVRSKNFNEVMLKTVNNIKLIFKNYEVKVFPGTKIVSPKIVAGSNHSPTLSIGLKKCKAFFCKSVQLNADISIENTIGNCQQNYLVRADMRRSGKILTDVYSNFEVKICANKTVSGGILNLKAVAVRSTQQENPPYQKDIKEVIGAQIDPIITALNKTLLITEKSVN